MFGPQARAAELQAVRSAAMRQKSHDAGEPIPTTAAVSLTEFARGQLTSRNKGSKQYKPLNLEELDDHHEDDLSAATDSSASNLEPKAIRSIPEDHSSLTSDTHLPTPSAPKAMLQINPIPPATTTLSQTPRTISRESPDDMFSTFGWLPTPTHGRLFYPTGSHAGSYASSKRPLVPADFVFGLNGYSPAKPELQLDNMKDYRSHATNNGFVFNLQPSGQYMQTTQAHMYHGLPFPYQRTGTVSTPQHSQNLGHFGADPSGFDDQYFQPRFERSSTFANDILHHENKLQEVRRDVPPSLETPYDRSTKMQSFVAAQQAMAKTGKTVLRNPQLLTPTPAPQDPQQHSVGSMRIQAVGDDNMLESQIDCTLAEDDPEQRSGITQGGIGQTSSGPSSKHDPFSSGFTPQPRSVSLLHDVTLDEKPSATISTLGGKHRRAEECSAIRNALLKRDARIAADASSGPADVSLTLPVTNNSHSRGATPSGKATPLGKGPMVTGWCGLHRISQLDRQRMKDTLVAMADNTEHQNQIFGFKKHQSVVGNEARMWMQLSTVENFNKCLAITKLFDEHNAMESLATAENQSGHREASKTVYERDAIAARGVIGILLALKNEEAEIDHDGNYSSRLDFNASKDVNTKMSLSASTKELQLDGLAMASAPARLARDPRYRPFSSRSGGFYGSMRLW